MEKNGYVPSEAVAGILHTLTGLKGNSIHVSRLLLFISLYIILRGLTWVFSDFLLSFLQVINHLLSEYNVGNCTNNNLHRLKSNNEKRIKDCLSCCVGTRYLFRRGNGAQIQGLVHPTQAPNL